MILISCEKNDKLKISLCPISDKYVACTWIKVLTFWLRLYHFCWSGIPGKGRLGMAVDSSPHQHAHKINNLFTKIVILLPRYFIDKYLLFVLSRSWRNVIAHNINVILLIQSSCLNVFINNNEKYTIFSVIPLQN